MVIILFILAEKSLARPEPISITTINGTLKDEIYSGTIPILPFLTLKI